MSLGHNHQVPALFGSKITRQLSAALPIDVGFGHAGFNEQVSTNLREAIQVLAAGTAARSPASFWPVFAPWLSLCLSRVSQNSLMASPTRRSRLRMKGNLSRSENAFGIGDPLAGRLRVGSVDFISD